MIQKNPLSENFLSFVPYFAVAVLLAIVLMATYTKRNEHPDEYVHINAAYYYADYHLPPAACDIRSKTSYSVYGFSRLDKFELSYFFNGKFVAMVKPLPVFDYVQTRLFNVTMFFLITLMAILLPSFRVFMLPVLLTPQIWYLFSYTNSEPFSIVVSMISAFLLFNQNSIFYQAFDKSKPWIKRTGYALICSFIAFCLLFVKESFYFFTLFLFFALLITHYKMLFNGEALALLKKHALTLSAMVAVTVSLSAAWMIPHYVVNDFERSEKMYQCRLEMSRPEYSPETPLEHTVATIYLKEKGYPMHYLLELGWHQKLFYTAVGYYGYTTIPADDGYYKLMAVALGFFFMVITGVVMAQSALRDNIRRFNWLPLILFTLMLLFAILIDFVSVRHSWNGDYQPQGRYLFSTIAMLGVVLYVCRNALVRYDWCRDLLFLATALLTGLSLFNFIYVGFTELPKLF